MDLETQGSESTELDLISAIGVVEAEEEPEAAETPEPEPTPEEPEAPDVNEEIQRLQRIIASDPAKRAAYEAEKYGVTPPVYTPPPVVETPKETTLEEAFAQAFPGEDFDPFNMKHQALLQQINLKPAFSYIEQVKQEEQEYRQQQQAETQRKAVEDLNKGVQELFVKGLPVAGDLLKAEKLDYKQETLLAQMETRFQRELQRKFPAREDGSHFRLWASPEVHREIVREVLPTIKQLAADLGLSQAPKTVSKQAARETYVESSNAVPATGGNPFAAALDKGDIASALGAFNKTYR